MERKAITNKLPTSSTRIKGRSERETGELYGMEGTTAHESVKVIDSLLLLVIFPN